MRADELTGALWLRPSMYSSVSNDGNYGQCETFVIEVLN